MKTKMSSVHNLMLVSILSSIFVVTLLSFPSPAEADYLYHVCPNTTTFTPNSTFQSNLNRLLSTLSSNATRPSGFYNATASSSSPNDRVYGLFLCRGDVSATDACKSCVSTATSDIFQRCPAEKQVVIWYDDCMLRYSNESFFSTMAEAPRLFMFNTQNVSGYVTDQNRFNQVLAASASELIAEASNNNRKFATKEANVSKVITLYVLGQCTQDLSSGDCNWCLLEAMAQFPRRKIGGRVLYPSCYVRFEVYPFYLHNSTAASPSPSPRDGAVSPPPTGSIIRPRPKGKVPPTISLPRKVSKIVHTGGRSRLSPSVFIGGSIAVAVVLVASGYFFVRRRSIRKKYKTAPNQENGRNDYDTKSVESLQFDLGTIETATNKFSENNKLGEGGFGVVFKGTLANGQEIAVKRLSKSSKQGVQEFKNEVALVAKLQHRNLVRLLGFCLEGEETILVYEYVPNRSLDYFLFESKKREQLDWSSRCMIAGGIARGILYLHEDSRLRVIHRDLKASNILLDGNMNPKISDFGMARMFGVEDQTQGNTKRIVGTYGYMAPEYAMEGLYSVKSDVFSFGVVLLEIVTGRRNFLGFHPTECAPTLIGYAWQLWNETKELELMDPLLKDSCSPNEYLKYLHIGLLCVQEDANNRPTMSSIVRMLDSEAISLPRPERPAFFTGRCIEQHDQENAPNCSTDNLTISIDVPR
ncbi:putative cysteine-rich receptor-like protein kinase 23 [Prunus dulcis]|uniref:putative cysteine-rich receptor-like protein kinase 23 n=1 Tax=Prunus dulcis TaxID=3755 RepID=UPI00148349D5|nr:putative cysteine-rich receptor-like protein kinase 23 [Prunus dulcis]